MSNLIPKLESFLNVCNYINIHSFNVPPKRFFFIIVLFVNNNYNLFKHICKVSRILSNNDFNFYSITWLRITIRI